MTQTLLPRHLWLEKLVAAPEQEVRALAEGNAVVHPFGRAEPSDAAATLLFGLEPDDPAVVAFDNGVLSALEFYRRQSPRVRYVAWELRRLSCRELL
jgi:hypothetical protein